MSTLANSLLSIKKFQKILQKHTNRLQKKYNFFVRKSSRNRSMKTRIRQFLSCKTKLGQIYFKENFEPYSI